MATMFRAFSFNPPVSPAYSAYEAERAAMNVSPTSRAESPKHMLNRPPTPPCTMGDLAAQLNQQCLRIDTNIRCYPNGPLTPASDDDDECASPTQERPTYSRVTASLLRMQRQCNSRMQCNSSHVRDISKLVKMIEHQDQCTVSESASASASRTSSTSSASTCASASSASSGEDEGVNMEYDIPVQGIETLVSMPAWRAGEYRDTCIRVTKPVRMRKRSRENAVCKRRL
ncbi:predicted protein [Pyrenophora tritici-repentis Pt-1C-BFP]|uniref:Uncharacterized protein n=1 Tax=Pyrenophora tritici-repentis (strain Pt-1C-BFP) TaxID=426418 RepID=B2W5D6_PYRTR|nr:uncharacterized protein PTRG_04836 [Pyrenophora tritici-repentis Pt-1C-BFP]EDU47743.1 predicted protein [Pyrenophora tritici-repentis Pt-1C-BFP]PWO26863.1 CDC6, Cdc6-related protein, AAA superfamily ATPase [Pyrenophora tritici-repentis]